MESFKTQTMRQSMILLERSTILGKGDPDK